MNNRQCPEWRRRDFLALGSAGVAATVVAGPRSAVWSAPLGLPVPAAGAFVEALSIAFVVGGEGPEDPSVDAGTSLSRPVDARALPAGDPGLAAQGVRLSIAGGFDPWDASLRHLASVAIDVDFRPFQDNVHHAWYFDNGAMPSMAPPVSLTVPVAADAGLSLIFEFRKDAASDAQRDRLSLTAGTERGLPKLRQGLYLLTWSGHGAGPLSAWTGCYWCAESGSLLRRGWRREEMMPAGFPYLVLSVERATRAAPSTA